MKVYKMVILLYRFEECCDLNHLVLAKRLVRQEIENLKGITEQKCRKRKVREDYCNYCSNSNCNYNPKKVSKYEKEILEKLEISNVL